MVASAVPSSSAVPVPGECAIEVFFDGACPLCRREVAMLTRRDRHHRIRATDISRPGFDPTSLGVRWSDLMAEIHGRLPDGSLITGVEVFRQLYGAIGLHRVVALTRWPVIAPLLENAYRLFARHRLRLTGRCHGSTCALPRGQGHVAGAAR